MKWPLLLSGLKLFKVWLHWVELGDLVSPPASHAFCMPRPPLCLCARWGISLLSAKYYICMTVAPTSIQKKITDAHVTQLGQNHLYSAVALLAALRWVREHFSALQGLGLSR